MIAAPWPREQPRTARLLHVDPTRGTLVERRIDDLRTLLHGGDLLVVNDAATLPASLPGTTGAGEPVEVRLWGEQADGSWRAVLFGAGDWRTPTEHRPPPPRLQLGDQVVAGGMRAMVRSVDEVTPRLVGLAFDRDGAAFWRELYRAGRPVQYAHVARPLALWHVQTAYAARPWAAEAPSAGFALSWGLLLELRRLGVALARVTHAAGLSATGDAHLDAGLPLAERYEIPPATLRAITATRERGGRIVAVGTSAVRALESGFAGGAGCVVAAGTTGLRLGPGTRRRVTDGIVTGVHDDGTSHSALLAAFAPPNLLARAQRHAEAAGFLGHEFGDAMVIL